MPTDDTAAESSAESIVRVSSKRERSITIDIRFAQRSRKALRTGASEAADRIVAGPSVATGIGLTLIDVRLAKATAPSDRTRARERGDAVNARAERHARRRCAFCIKRTHTHTHIHHGRRHSTWGSVRHSWGGANGAHGGWCGQSRKERSADAQGASAGVRASETEKTGAEDTDHSLPFHSARRCTRSRTGN